MHFAMQLLRPTQSAAEAHAVPSAAHTPSNVVSANCLSAQGLAMQLVQSLAIALQPSSFSPQVAKPSAAHRSWHASQRRQLASAS